MLKESGSKSADGLTAANSDSRLAAVCEQHIFLGKGAQWATYSHWSTTASELFDLIFCAVTNLAVIVGIRLKAAGHRSILSDGSLEERTVELGRCCRAHPYF